MLDPDTRWSDFDALVSNNEHSGLLHDVRGCRAHHDRLGDGGVDVGLPHPGVAFAAVQAAASERAARTEQEQTCRQSNL
jgi:hypothetical protein